MISPNFKKILFFSLFIYIDHIGEKLAKIQRTNAYIYVEIHIEKLSIDRFSFIITTQIATYVDLQIFKF